MNGKEALMASNASVAVRTQSPAYQAYQILHLAFVVAPILAGADKFFHVLVNWDQYLSPAIARMLPVSGHTFMLAAGAIEVVAGLLVAFMPAVGGLVVGAWLCGIIINLLTIPAYFDVALRDLGLALGAFALARLAAEFDVRS
ncbi:MAG: hypothetical protein DMF93_09255 [Acidobacteria bacterium]|nr:MAG: hypothetical protein DMF93_09255 [Acidobacteriota bacterium]